MAGQRFVGGSDEPSEGGFDAENLEAAAGYGFGAHILAGASGIVELRGLETGMEAHGEEIGVVARGVAEQFIQGIAEGVRFVRLVVGTEKGRENVHHGDELVRCGKRQGPEDQRVDQREGRGARADGQRQ